MTKVKKLTDDDLKDVTGGRPVRVKKVDSELKADVTSANRVKPTVIKPILSELVMDDDKFKKIS